MDSSVRIRVAAVIQRDGALLMVRHLKAGRTYWMLPGGGVDHGETMAEALVRELREEVCIEIAPGPLVLASDAIAPDGARHVVNLCFLADHVGGTPRVGGDERIVEVAWQPIGGLPALPMFPDFGPTLAELARQGFPGRAPNLGNLWRD